MRRAVLAALALACATSLGELALRVRGGWPGGRAGGDGRPVVLCVGDSLTRGRPDPENYPSELERMLLQRTGKHYRVLNLGVPGLTTTQLRARFVRYLDYYRPIVVLHWGGIDNAWRHPETKKPRGALAEVADRSRLFRQLREWFLPRATGGYGYDRAGIEASDWVGPYAIWRVAFGGVEEEISTVFTEPLPPAEVGATVRDDLTAMMRAARDRGIAMYLVRYSFWHAFYKEVNRAIVDVSSDFAVPYVDASAAVDALRAETPMRRLFDEVLHPLPVLYWQVAEEAYGVLARERVVAAAP